MTNTHEMIDAVPGGVPLGADRVAAAIDACLGCVQSCTTCANADVAEDGDAELAVIYPLLQACVRTCTSSAEEWARHARHHVHCAICEKVCRACVEACTAVLGAG